MENPIEKRLKEQFLKYSVQDKLDAESLVAVCHHVFARKVTMPEARELVTKYGTSNSNESAWYLNYEQLNEYCKSFGIFLSFYSGVFRSVLTNPDYKINPTSDADLFANLATGQKTHNLVRFAFDSFNLINLTHVERFEGEIRNASIWRATQI
jgi:hypothetical protein